MIIRPFSQRVRLIFKKSPLNLTKLSQICKIPRLRSQSWALLRLNWLIPRTRPRTSKDNSLRRLKTTRKSLPPIMQGSQNRWQSKKMKRLLLTLNSKGSRIRSPRKMMRTLNSKKILMSLPKSTIASSLRITNWMSSLPLLRLMRHNAKTLFNLVIKNCTL